MCIMFLLFLQLEKPIITRDPSQWQLPRLLRQHSTANHYPTFQQLLADSREKTKWGAGMNDSNTSCFDGDFLPIF